MPIERTVAGVFGRFVQQSSLVFTLAAGATLMFRRAADHRRREERATRIKDELTLLHPFIDRLPIAQQNLILATVASKYFLGGTSEVKTPDDGATIAELIRQTSLLHATGEEQGGDDEETS